MDSNSITVPFSIMNLRPTYILLSLAFSVASPVFAASISCAPTVAAQEDEAQWNFELPQAVKHALDAADRSLLSPFLASTVELQLPDCSGIFSKKQAEMILAKFLAGHRGLVYYPCREETIADATLTIGRFSNSNADFGVYVLTQSVNGSKQIKQFRIEEQK